MFHVPNQYRLRRHPQLGSDDSYGNNGFFIFKRTVRGKDTEIRCQASDGEGWEHVSVSVNAKRCPSWNEMCYVKDLFWDKEDCVIQYHPPASEYVSTHDYVLHLWRPTTFEQPVPEKIFVGIPKSKYE